jgi:hypothetical protein
MPSFVGPKKQGWLALASPAVCLVLYFLYFFYTASLAHFCQFTLLFNVNKEE